MIIRVAQVKDIDAIFALYKTLFAEMAKLQPERFMSAEQDRAFIEQSIQDDKYYLAVAEIEGNIEGFVVGQTQETPKYNCLVPRSYGYIFDIVVSPRLRNQGAGHQLLEAMKSWSRSQHHSHLELSVLAQNKDAMRLYIREGFEEVLRTVAIKL